MKKLHILALLLSLVVLPYCSEVEQIQPQSTSKASTHNSTSSGFSSGCLTGYESQEVRTVLESQISSSDRALYDSFRSGFDQQYVTPDIVNASKPIVLQGVSSRVNDYVNLIIEKTQSAGDSYINSLRYENPAPEKPSDKGGPRFYYGDFDAYEFNPQLTSTISDIENQVRNDAGLTGEEKEYLLSATNSVKIILPQILVSSERVANCVSADQTQTQGLFRTLKKIVNITATLVAHTVVGVVRGAVVSIGLLGPTPKGLVIGAVVGGTFGFAEGLRQVFAGRCVFGRC